MDSTYNHPKCVALAAGIPQGLQNCSSFCRKAKNFPFFYHTIQHRQNISIFHLYHGSLAPFTKDELPQLFLVSLVKLMTLIENAVAALPPLLHIRLITPSTLMDPLVEGQETGLQQQLSLEDPQSSLKWIPNPSKPKEEHSPVAMESALFWTSTNTNHPSISILFCTDSNSICEALISSNPQTFSIHNSINSISFSIFIQWISGHSPIPGNVLADKAAKEATTITTDTILVSFSSSIQVINETICNDLSTHEHQHLK